MKKAKNIFFLITIAALAGLWSCSKEQHNEIQQSSALNPKGETKKLIAIGEASDLEEYNKLIAANFARLAASGINQLRSCVETASVPEDYATIGQAIDAVCDGGKVFVNAGVYDELVYINKPGLDIKANGNVTLNGGFILGTGADDVSIQQFKINPGPNPYGIYAAGVSGGQVKLNTVTGGAIAIRYTNSSGVSVTHNTISGSNWGIFFTATTGFASDNNTIAHNTITGISHASPIHLEKNCNNNMIRNNTITMNTNTFNAAIMLYSIPGETCDNNTIRNNYVYDNATVGLFLYQGGSGNIIGPNNSFNTNNIYGIYLGAGSLDNHVFNNTALDNGLCDIVNAGTGNTFVKNVADCTSGL